MAEIENKNSDYSVIKPWEKRQFDPKAVITEYKTAEGKVYPIDWSWYMTVNDLLENLRKMSWSSAATIWVGFNKLRDAILGNVPVRKMSKGERAFIGDFGAMGVGGGGFVRMFVDDQEFNEYIKEQMWEKQFG